MKENIITVCAVAVSVFFIGLPFVHRAMRYRKNMKHLSAGRDAESNGQCDAIPTRGIGEEIFMSRYVGLRQPPFTAGKTVRIRPQYYRRIQEIIAGIGHDKVTIISYVDNVLKAHFDDNRETVDSLFKEQQAPDIRGE